jgi:polysaccharide export outer membrane protein
MKRAILCIPLVVLWLTACSGGPSREDVIAQGRSDGRIAFDVVKVDDAVLTTLLAQPPPAFHERFKKYLPPADLKISVGDMVSVFIWESAANGLFGTSLTELSFPAGASARLLTGQSPGAQGALDQTLGLTVSPDTLALLFGGAGAQSAAGAQGGAEAQGLTGLTDQTFAFSGSLSSPTTNSAGTASGVSAGTASGFTAETATSPAAGTTPARAAQTSSGPRQPGDAENPSAQRLEDLMSVAEESGRPGTRIPDQQVASDGAISIPYAGRIAAAGRTPSEVQHTIEKRLGPKALDPRALVIVEHSAANSVSVAGEVIDGARVPLSPGGDRLLQVIAAAGGAKAPVHDTFVQLSRDGVTAMVPLATLVTDPGQDIFAEPGDVLTLVRHPQTFSVFGATGKNAAITFTSDRLSLAEALAKAGGLLDERADPRAVFLLRYEPVSLVQALGQPIAAGAHDGLSPIVYRLDLQEAKSYLLARRFPMHDKDIIYIADAEIMPIYHVFQALQQLVGPATNALVVCTYTKC